MKFAIINTILSAAQKAIDNHAREFTCYGKRFVAEFNDYNSGRFLIDGADCGLRFYDGKAVIA